MVDKDRRRFIAVGGMGSMIFGYLLISSFSERLVRMGIDKINMSVQDLNDQKPTHPYELLKNFYNSGSHELMRRYVTGFTSVILPWSVHDAGTRIRNLRDIQSHSNLKYENSTVNRHRLKAFPACVASHLIPSCTESEVDLAFAGDLISNAMLFPQREIQEIIPQNLISTITRDDYSWNNFWLPDSVIESMVAYLSKRHDNPILCTGSNFSVQFLLYYRLSINTRRGIRTDDLRRQNELIDKAFREIDNSKDEYAWFVKQWLHTFSKYCENVSNSSNVRELLPPQSSELAMGWQNCSNNNDWKPLISVSMLNNALSLHLNNEIVEGRGNPKWFQDEYGPDEAKVAREKGVEWFDKLAFSDELLSEAINKSSGPVKGTMHDIAIKTKHLASPSNDWTSVYSLVPFREKLNPFYINSDKVAGNIMPIIHAAGGYLFINSVRKNKDNIVSLAKKYWDNIAEVTPPQINEEVKPTDDDLERISSRRDFLKMFDVIGLLSEGDTTEYDNLVDNNFNNDNDDSV